MVSFQNQHLLILGRMIAGPKYNFNIIAVTSDVSENGKWGYIVSCRGASQLGGPFQGNPPRV